MEKPEKHKAVQEQGELTYTMTYKDVVDLLEIADSSPCHELHVELGDLKLTIVKRGS